MREREGWFNCGLRCCVLFFFFKQKTAYEIYQCDWSSDVCSSDLWLYVPLVYQQESGLNGADKFNRDKAEVIGPETSLDRKSVV